MIEDLVNNQASELPSRETIGPCESLTSLESQVLQWCRPQTGLRIAFAGDSGLIRGCARIAVQAGHSVTAVLTNSEVLAAKSGAEISGALVAGITLENLLSIAARSDVMFSVVNQTIFPEELLKLPPLGCVNYHDSLLPAYAGVNATSWALLSGERVHGITWHLMVEKVDAGPILVQRSVQISEADTAFAVNLRCFEAAIATFSGLLASLTDGTVRPREQNLERRTYYSGTRRPPANAVLNFQSGATQVSRTVRALTCGPSQMPASFPKAITHSQVLLVGGVEILSDISSGPPGTVVQVGPGPEIVVETSDRRVVLREIRDSSGRPATSTWLNAIIRSSAGRLIDGVPDFVPAHVTD